MFAYRDTIRVVEAHRYGESANGNRLLNAWLRPGHSRTTPEGGWRNFQLDDIENLQLLDETFAGPRRGYAPYDARLTVVFAELAVAPADAAQPDTSAPDAHAMSGRAGEPGHGDYHEPPDAKHIDPNPPQKDEIGA